MSTKPMDPIERLDAYNRGEILPEVAARLKVPEPQKPTQQRETDFAPETLGRALYRRERDELEELVSMPGWRVLQRVLERASENHRKHAISESQNNPLGRTAEISQAWALSVMFERAQREMYASVDVELSQLKMQKEGKS